ncbi:CsbD family protein [Edaphobacter aggregans]|uniref:CsbD family protein n=1 Tax=Edaphobacter aggregans TaxID=570835 RepID=UPI000557F5CD|nr:CsbD family protein [Edaphobacter aggregans]
MNKETVEGKFDQAAGAVKQKVGETLGNQNLANSGAADQVKGAAKETWGEAKDVAAERRDDAAVRTNDAVAQTNVERESLAQRTEDAAHSLREKLVEGAQSAKTRINEKLGEIKERYNRA